MIERPIISILLTLIPLIAIVAIEYLGRRYNIASEITRKSIHATLGITAVLGFIEGPTWLFAIIVLLMALLIILSFHKKLLSSIHGIKRLTYGEIFLPIGILATLLITTQNPNIYTTSILVLALADSGAGLTGYWLKKKSKTITGSLVFFAIAFTIILLFNNSPILTAIILAFGSTVVERFSPYGSDNLTVPLGLAGLMLLFNV